MNKEVIKGELVYEAKSISLEYHVKNWGKPFDRASLNKKIIETLNHNNINAIHIKKIYVDCSLISYTSENGQSAVVTTSSRSYTIDDIIINVELQSGEVEIFPFKELILV